MMASMRPELYCIIIIQNKQITNQKDSVNASKKINFTKTDMGQFESI
jgi:hypothetical protein